MWREEKSGVKVSVERRKKWSEGECREKKIVNMKWRVEKR